MNRFEEIIKSVSPKPAVVVHIGAGSGNEYEFYRTLDPNRIILVEADHKITEISSREHSGSAVVSVVECAIATKSEQRLLKITNNPQFSSLANPTGLIEFYPNIEVIDEVQVDAMTLEDLCLQTDIVDESDNVLVAELRGQEKEVFPSTAKEILHKFKWIVIRSSEFDLYESAKNKKHKDLGIAMRDAGFTVLIFKEDTPPFLDILCIRNEARRDNQILKRQNDDLKKTIGSLERDYSRKTTKLKELKLGLNKQLTGLKKSLKTKTTEESAARKEVKSLTKSSENQQVKIESLLGTISSRTAELTQTQAQIQGLISEKNDLSRQVRELSSSVDTRSGELSQSLSQIQSLNAEREDQLKQIKELSNAIGAKSGESVKMQVRMLTTEKEKHLQQIKTLSSAVDTRSGELIQAQAQIKSLSEEKKEQLQQIKSLSNAADTGSSELNRARAQLESLKEEKKELLQQIKKLSGTIETKSAGLTKAKTQLQLATAKKKEQLQKNKDLSDTLKLKSKDLLQSNARLQSLEAEKGVQTDNVKELSKELGQAQTKVKSLTGVEEDLSEQIRTHTSLMKMKKKELANLQKTLQISNKLVLKADTDLKDLQLQYRDALRHQDKQHTLLCELKVKLGQASKYYQRLNWENQVLEGDIVSNEDSETVESTAGGSDED